MLTGAGAFVALAGVPIGTVLAVELALYCVLPISLAIAIEDRVGGALAVAFAAAVPLLVPFGMLQAALRTPAAAFGVTAFGLVFAAAVVAATQTREHEAVAAPPREARAGASA
jgi:hypothetical protein